ncbi:hypothetical protein GV794_19550 [Nocardia cyriacigeorgica]|uniref:Uncharacterized protein n=1 Tax=Nocardia cyriacigeorgica TaxID=135487 RepID=A0A6P1D6W8_9NOCA|nr:hypothetical protein [Nocardia cyriacigeorgica]NEW41405.1 hypothetical protein [Nocardia cyriacigeorgica]NEW44750.1 hypothetical protein [Nocardia cyriacigeorgica]NEW50848.1 hypothetical protein [Nocardia cyriacigeorgica]NEW57834.1 hypothetical protein [Nocardia cyriacigeorgica]
MHIHFERHHRFTLARLLDSLGFALLLVVAVMAFVVVLGAIATGATS